MTRLEELLLLWQDQTLTEGDLAELKALLASPEERTRAAEEFFLTGVVLESLQAQRAALCEGPSPRPPPRSGEGVKAWLLTLAPPLRFGEGAGGRGLLVWLAAASLLIVLGAILYFRAPPAPPVPAAVFAQFDQVQGETFVVSKEHKRPAQTGQVLVPGQGIATEGADSEAVVQMKGVRLQLGGDTVLFTTAEAEEANAEGPKVKLEQGDLQVKVTRALKRKHATVQTPLGVAVTLTEETALHVSDAMGVVVVRGEVLFTHKEGKSLRISGGHYVVATPAGELYAAQLFSGPATVWTTLPQAGLDTSSLGCSVVFSPDEKRLAAAGRSGEGCVRLGPVEGPPSPTELPGERCVAFSADGKLLATTSQGNVLLHDMAGGKQACVLAAKDRRARVHCLAFAPDGKTLAVGRAGSKDPTDVEIWDVATGTPRATWHGHAGGCNCLAFSPDGKLLASGGLDSSVVLWDPATGTERTRLAGPPALVVWGLAFASDGKTLAVAAGAGDFRLRQPGEVQLWDLAARQVRATLHGHTRAVTSVVFSGDGQTLITGSADTTLRFWELARGREYGMLKGHQAAPGFEALALALSPDGDSLATASLDRTVKLWKTIWFRKGPAAEAQAGLPLPWLASLGGDR